MPYCCGYHVGPGLESTRASRSRAPKPVARTGVARGRQFESLPIARLARRVEAATPNRTSLIRRLLRKKCRFGFDSLTCKVVLYGRFQPYDGVIGNDGRRAGERDQLQRSPMRMDARVPIERVPERRMRGERIERRIALAKEASVVIWVSRRNVRKDDRHDLGRKIGP